MDANIFLQNESNVRFYCRYCPVVFRQAKGSFMFTENGDRYLDFFAGAGALNYGHNNPYIKQKLLQYLSEDNIIHSLDFYTVAKRDFIQQFKERILDPRGLKYKFQFCGPTGTNAVEAALKLARKAKGRPGIFAFMGGYHGMSLGSLAVTSQIFSRAGAGVALHNVTFMPYPGGAMDFVDSIDYMDAILADERSGVEKPAAVIFETVQAEGGVIVAPVAWLQRLKKLCDRHDILLICDDIQVGCGRTGPFFSFENSGIQPDIVVLSKSISGFGLPLSMVLLKPELDHWKPGEHNGTFRGNQLAFVGGVAALEYRVLANLETAVKEKEQFVHHFLQNEILPLNNKIKIRGVGLIWGIDLSGMDDPELSRKIADHCFQFGLIVELAGQKGQVLKLLPPLNIEMEDLREGCNIIKQACAACLPINARFAVAK